MNSRAALPFLQELIVPTVSAEATVAPMLGRSRAFLMRCTDHSLYVVKFRERELHARALAGEMLATRMGIWVGLPFPPPAFVGVGECLRSQCGIRPGLQFGSGFVDRCLDMFPASMFGRISNRQALAGMLVFDAWTGATEKRRVLFMRDMEESYQIVFLGNSHCFNSGLWNFSRCAVPPGLRRAAVAYHDVRSWESFEPWLTAIENFPEPLLLRLAAQVPPDWYRDDSAALQELCQTLLERRTAVRRMIGALHHSPINPFPNWEQA